MVAKRVEMMCRERLSLHGTGQPIDRDHPPNLPEIWSRRHNDVPALLQSNVDAVIAQVSSVTNVYFGPQCQHHCFLLCCKQQTLNLLLTPVLVVPLAFARMCAL